MANLSANHRNRRRTLFGSAVAALLVAAAPAVVRAEPVHGRAAIQTIATQWDFKTLADRLEAAVKDAGLLVVTRASASAGAAGRGVTIPGDLVLGVFRNDFAVRMLAADVAAGIEAPIPIHVFETQGGHASLAYRTPSTLFRPYGSAALDSMAAELNTLFRQIVTQAARK